mmetsp:Transcript_28040/g.78647  ORF Transcript_28040/g.78647 Transcript_28040/m.78647 type:complete len:201 (+) Transcript_28040:879-1481(+)
MTRARSYSPCRSSKAANCLKMRAWRDSSGSNSCNDASKTVRASSTCLASHSAHLANRRKARAHGYVLTYLLRTASARSTELLRVSNLAYDSHALSSGCHFIHRSKTARHLGVSCTISSMYTYLYHRKSMRGSSWTARSSTLRAWLTNSFLISNSAYRSQSSPERPSTSRARSKMLRARSYSLCSSSNRAYLTQFPMCSLR